MADQSSADKMFIYQFWDQWGQLVLLDRQALAAAVAEAQGTPVPQVRPDPLVVSVSLALADQLEAWARQVPRVTRVPRVSSGLREIPELQV